MATTPSRSNTVSTLKKYAKISDETPSRMQPTFFSVLWQILTAILGISTAIIHALAINNKLLLYPVSIIWIFVAGFFVYSEVDFKAFKLLIVSFRGGFIAFATILSVICNISRKLFVTDNIPFLTLIIDDITFILSIIIMAMADCAPRMTNLIRLMGPTAILLNVTWLVVRSVVAPDADYTFFTYDNGSVTLNDIVIACFIQIFWFGFPYIYGVPRDPGHRFFVLIDDKILSKQLLPYKNISTEFTWKIPTKRLFMMFECIALLFTLFYAITTLIDHQQDIKIALLVINVLLAIFMILLTIILIYVHFQWYMIRELLKQFRCNMLVITILMMIYCAIQKLFWYEHNDDIITFIVDVLLNHLVFILAALLCLVRDGMNISYPNYFVVFSSIMIFLISSWNVLLLTFKVNNKYPLWFILMEKQAYYSVMVICFLFIYYVWIDRDNQYFVLIRKRKKTKQLWGDNESHDDCNNIAMNETLLHEYDINDTL